jgi:hypothetical protein
MLDEDAILALVTAMVVFAICGCSLGMAICPCSCRPSRDCRRTCADCKKDRETCRKRCLRDCSRERADTEEELIP